MATFGHFNAGTNWGTPAPTYTPPPSSNAPQSYGNPNIPQGPSSAQVAHQAQQSHSPADYSNLINAAPAIYELLTGGQGSNVKEGQMISPAAEKAVASVISQLAKSGELDPKASGFIPALVAAINGNEEGAIRSATGTGVGMLASQVLPKTLSGLSGPLGALASGLVSGDSEDKIVNSVGNSLINFGLKSAIPGIGPLLAIASMAGLDPMKLIKSGLPAHYEPPTFPMGTDPEMIRQMGGEDALAVYNNPDLLQTWRYAPGDMPTMGLENLNTDSLHNVTPIESLSLGDTVDHNSPAGWLPSQFSFSGEGVNPEDYAESGVWGDNIGERYATNRGEAPTAPTLQPHQGTQEFIGWLISNGQEQLARTAVNSFLGQDYFKRQTGYNNYVNGVNNYNNQVDAHNQELTNQYNTAHDQWESMPDWVTPINYAQWGISGAGNGPSAGLSNFHGALSDYGGGSYDFQANPFMSYDSGMDFSPVSDSAYDAPSYSYESPSYSYDFPTNSYGQGVPGYDYGNDLAYGYLNGVGNDPFPMLYTVPSAQYAFDSGVNWDGGNFGGSFGTSNFSMPSYSYDWNAPAWSSSFNTPTTDSYSWMNTPTSSFSTPSSSYMYTPTDYGSSFSSSSFASNPFMGASS